MNDPFQPPANESIITSDRDHGCLPDWRTEDLPEPLPFTGGNVLRTIGPGAILLAGSIGGGEWIIGPMTAVQYGAGILWIATAGILLQMIFNLEAIRYTLYTGEPILTGIMRLRPGSRFWGLLYIVLGIVQLATPALALGCASVLFAAGTGDLPAKDGADSTAVMWISYGVLVGTVLMLLSGKSIERLLERLSWAMVIFIFSFLLVANFLFVPLEIWKTTALGFLVPGALPKNMDVVLLGVFAATAGSGGLGNLAISNWCRDKGFGMGGLMGSIGGILADGHTELSSTGCVFPATAANLRRWKTWWKYVLIDQMGLWAIGCVLGMYLNVNLALAIVPGGKVLTGYEAGTFQAQFMAAQLWKGFWVLALFNGFWILFSTQLGNMDCLTRVVSDICWSGWPRLQKLTSSRLYARWLMIFLVWGIVALTLGDNVVSLFKILGLVASPILAFGAFQILKVNRRFLPKEVQPPLWRQFCLVICGLFFFVLTIASFYSLAKDLMAPAKPNAVVPTSTTNDSATSPPAEVETKSPEDRQP